MKDPRLHNDCDGGHCVACQWDRDQAALRSDRRAWFDANATGPMRPEDLEQWARTQIEDAVRATLPITDPKKRVS